jgi:hypothetical protein
VTAEVTAAIIAGWVALLGAAVSSYLTHAASHRQRNVDLLVSALGDMGSGTQRRSAAIAALTVMRGPLDRRMGYTDRRLWAQYGTGVGQQLFRVSAYVLNHAKVTTHGVENAIAMADWLLADPVLGFTDPDQRRRLLRSLDAYDAKLSDTRDQRTAAGGFHARLKVWRKVLAT